MKVASIRKRMNKDGSASYRVEVRLKGCPPQRASFPRITDAKRWARNTESAIQENRYFKTTESRKHTLADLIDRYIDNVLPSKKDHKRQKAQYEWWKSQLGDYTLGDVTPSLISEIRDKLSEGKAPATVVRYLSALSHAFTVAVNEWEWIEDNPVLRVRKPKEPRGRVRFLSDDEVLQDGSIIYGERTRLLNACAISPNKVLYTIVVLALSTGMRQGEMMNLRWSDVDLKQARIILHETKNGERRVVPLYGHSLDLLKQLSKVRNLKTDLLFPGKKVTSPVFIRAPWKNAVESAGIENFRFHDLRHSAASYLAMNGASMVEIADVLGHKTLSMVKRYAHLSEAHTASVVASMNEKIFG